MGCSSAYGRQVTLYANALAVALSEKLSLDEQNVVGNLLTLAGASLLSIAAVNQSQKKNDGTQSGGETDTAAGGT